MGGGESPLVSGIPLPLFVNELSLEILEGGDRDVCHVGIQLLLGILVVIALASTSNTDAVLNGFDALDPDLLIQAGVDTHILCSHHQLCKGLDGLDGMGCTLLEGPEHSRVNRNRAR